MSRRILAKASVALAIVLSAQTVTAWAESPVLKIGFVGVTSGPAAAWGISNQRSMETRAAWINETGGYTIGDTTYDIAIVSFDDQKDPKRAIAGMEKMVQEGIHYVVGPNVDDGAAAVWDEPGGIDGAGVRALLWSLVVRDGHPDRLAAQSHHPRPNAQVADG